MKKSVSDYNIIQNFSVKRLKFSLVFIIFLVVSQSAFIYGYFLPNTIDPLRDVLPADIFRQLTEVVDRVAWWSVLWGVVLVFFMVGVIMYLRAIGSVLENKQIKGRDRGTVE